MPTAERFEYDFVFAPCVDGADSDTQGTDVTRTGVSYRRVIAAAAITNNSALQCSMQFSRDVQPTAPLPELTNSAEPPDYKFTWNSSAVVIIGLCTV